VKEVHEDIIQGKREERDIEQSRREFLQMLSTGIIMIPQSFVELEHWKHLSSIATKSVIANETSLRHFEELIKGCWSLLKIDGLVAAEQLLLTYLPTLEILAQQPSKYQKALGIVETILCIIGG